MRSVTVILAIAVMVAWSGLPAGAAPPDPQAACTAAGNDDTVRPFQASLRPGFVKAFKQLYPQVKDGPSADVLSPGLAVYRCMEGRLLACFVGANLPCAKIATTRQSPGAAAFCKQQPDADVVPAFATGHDTLYSYQCRGGRAVVSGQNWQLDQRGFATQIWAPMD